MAVLLVSCGPSGYQRDEGFVFGTVYSIVYQSDDNLQADIESELQKVDAEFSMFNPQSTVSRINQGDSSVERSEMFMEVSRLSEQVNKETKGAFDVTVAPLVNAWGFGFKHEHLPSDEQVDSLLKIRNQLDFSAIAKGYGCDVVARLLQSRGITNYMVEIGGEVVVSGTNPQGTGWNIGVTKPTDDSLTMNGELQTVLHITDKAMATSGNYRNFYYQDGRKYAHTIDPRTGYPVQHSLLSATVLANDCAVADAYATSFMVLGVEEAQKVLKKHPELQAYLIYTDEKGLMKVWASPGMADYER